MAGRPLSSRARFVIAACVATLPLVALVAYAAVDRYNADRDRATLRATTRSQLYSTLLAGMGGQPSQAALKQLLVLAPLTATGGVVDLLDGSGRVVASSGTGRELPPASNPRVAEALAHSPGTFKLDGPGDHEWVWGVAPVENSDATAAYGIAGSEVYGASRTALERDLALAVIAAAAAIAAAFLLAGRVTAPIRRLAAQVGGEGRADDLGTLEHGIQRLDARIAESQAELALRADELERLNAELEERVRVRTAQLEEANAELEAFSYSVSHDLRAPLRAIDGFSRLLLEDHAGGLDAEGRRYLEQVGRSTQDMATLIDGLLAFSRLGQRPLDRHLVDVEAIAHEAADTVGAGNGRAPAISIGPLPEARADPTLLRQVFANLLSNALKFTRDEPDPRIEVASYRDNGSPPVYVVRDNGVGFDMRYADKLFTVFQRLHRQEDYEGTGIGLALVARIVDRHGGEIWVDATPGEGAAFHFTLEGSEQ